MSLMTFGIVFAAAYLITVAILVHQLWKRGNRLWDMERENMWLRTGHLRLDGSSLIAVERKRQIESEEWTAEHDDQWTQCELLMAAVCYTKEARDLIRWGTSANISEPPNGWVWNARWWKPSDDPIRNLQKAGALIAAEIDRIKRIDAAKGGGACVSK